MNSKNYSLQYLSIPGDWIDEVGLTFTTKSAATLVLKRKQKPWPDFEWRVVEGVA